MGKIERMTDVLSEVNKGTMSIPEGVSQMQVIYKLYDNKTRDTVPKLTIKRTHPDAKSPIKSTSGGFGWDVFAAEIVYGADGRYVIYFGFDFKAPSGFEVDFIPFDLLFLASVSDLTSGTERGCRYLFKLIPNGISTHLSRSMVSSVGNSGVFSNSISDYPNLTYSSLPFVVGDKVGKIVITPVYEFNIIES